MSGVLFGVRRKKVEAGERAMAKAVAEHKSSLAEISGSHLVK